MKITKLAEEFYLYTIPSGIKDKLGHNFYVILDGKKALMIDAGYKKDCIHVLDELKSKGIEVTDVIPTHFHPDHIEGILLMNDPTIYGNQYAIDTIKLFFKQEDVDKLKPDIIIDDEYKMDFGNFHLTFKQTPGHSDCSMTININNEYLHIGDLYLKTDSGDEVLPFVKWAGVKDHIKSLDKILSHKDKTFLISHGLCPCEYEEIKEGADDRKIYLNALVSSNNTVSAADATKNCSKPFKMMKWRAFVK